MEKVPFFNTLKAVAAQASTSSTAPLLPQEMRRHFKDLNAVAPYPAGKRR
jgi:hypothetical protein